MNMDEQYIWFWLVLWNIFIFPYIGNFMSSQLLLTPSFFRGVGLNHQPVHGGVSKGDRW